MNKIILNGLDIQGIEKLTQDESVELLKRIKDGDKKAKDRFIIANLKLVLSLVQRYGYKKDIEDMFQVGVLGLIKAIDGFDLSYNVKFSTYAVPMILGEIRKLNKDNQGIKVPRALRDIAYKALNYKTSYEQTHSYGPTMLEIANELDVPIKDVALSLDSISDVCSLQDNVYDDGDDAIMLMDQIADTKTSEENWINNIVLRDSINALNEKEKDIIMLRYYVGKTQVEISKQLKMSQAQVSRIENNAISKIRDNFK